MSYHFVPSGLGRPCEVRAEIVPFLTTITARADTCADAATGVVRALPAALAGALVVLGARALCARLPRVARSTSRQRRR